MMNWIYWVDLQTGCEFYGIDGGYIQLIHWGFEPQAWLGGPTLASAGGPSVSAQKTAIANIWEVVIDAKEIAPGRRSRDSSIYMDKQLNMNTKYWETLVFGGILVADKHPQTHKPSQTHHFSPFLSWKKHLGAQALQHDGSVVLHVLEERVDDLTLSEHRMPWLGRDRQGTSQASWKNLVKKKTW